MYRAQFGQRPLLHVRHVLGAEFGQLLECGVDVTDADSGKKDEKFGFILNQIFLPFPGVVRIPPLRLSLLRRLLIVRILDQTA